MNKSGNSFAKSGIISSREKSTLGAAGHHIMGSSQMEVGSGKGGVPSFKTFTDELENDINETRKELQFCKKEVQVLNSERDTVLEMAKTKCDDIDRYLHKEISYLEELIHKACNK